MSLDVQALQIPDVLLVRSKKHLDARGFFSETYNKSEFASAGIKLDFVQDNHAYSARAGTIRGLHFQSPPYAQHKLIRVVRGRIFDVAVDLRTGSPSYGKYLAVELSAENWTQILIPIGFAHGLCTLEPDTEVVYKVTNYYSAKHDLGIRWDDQDIAIRWPINAVEISDRDRSLPSLRATSTCF